MDRRDFFRCLAAIPIALKAAPLVAAAPVAPSGQIRLGDGHVVTLYDFIDDRHYGHVVTLYDFIDDRHYGTWTPDGGEVEAFSSGRMRAA